MEQSDTSSWLGLLLREPRDVQEAIVASLTPDQQRQLEEATRDLLRWRPLSGPQTTAYESRADILLYGGAAGGGKTDLLLGVARYGHSRSLIFRRVYPSLRAIVDRSRQIYNPEGMSAAVDSYNESLHRWRFGDGALVQFGSLQYDKDVTDYQGQPFDLYGFDEITEFTEAQFRFVTGWNRTTRQGQRCRIVCTGNPPTSADGEWVIRYWAPWLDESHPRPARPGELRWFTTVDGKDLELDGPEAVVIKGETVRPRSRTFIPARVQDNPYLVEAGYVSTLQALPEPLRSKMLYGDFRAGREDDAYQIIPSEWVRLAQERWKDRPRPESPMAALGVDVARGGKDRTVITPRYDNWIGEQVIEPGKSTPDGGAVATLAIAHRRDDATVNIDVIGVGSSPYDHLTAAIGDRAVAMNGATGSDARDKSGQLGFVNARAEWYWSLREALDPTSGQEMALPPDPELRADLCAPRWRLTPRGIQVEAKDDIIKRIGRSPDKGDSCVYACAIKMLPGAGLIEYMRQQAEAKAKTGAAGSAVLR
jgi:hypothetical protein